MDRKYLNYKKKFYYYFFMLSIFMLIFNYHIGLRGINIKI